mgnify:CR=1 FL=1
MRIEEVIKSWELTAAFNGQWYGIFINPFYITRRQIFEAVRDFANTISSDAVVLDVGCGMKPYRSLWKTKHYIGIDVKGGGLKDQAKKADKYFDGQNIPYTAKKFDVVIATEVLEHVEFPEKLLQEVQRVLKPKGKLFLTMPFVWPEHGIPFDFQRYTSFKHRKILSKCGFKTLSVKSTTGAFGTCGQVLSDFIYAELSGWIWRSGFPYGMNFILVRLVTFIFLFPIQLIFEILDTIFKRKGITLDFVVIAEK